jgi:hypothetical protein
VEKFIERQNMSNSIQIFPRPGVLVRFAGFTEDEMAFTKDIEEFDPQTLRILGEALDDAWQRVKRNHLNGRAYAARSVLAQHIYAMAKQGERDPRHLIDGALMRLKL